MSAARFHLGRVVATPGALQALEQAGHDPIKLLARHVSGDWGDLDEHDRRENEFSVANGFRILSAYTLSTGMRIWIITEADRSVTTLLLPASWGSSGSVVVAPRTAASPAPLARLPITVDNLLALRA